MVVVVCVCVRVIDKKYFGEPTQPRDNTSPHKSLAQRELAVLSLAQRELAVLSLAQRELAPVRCATLA